MRKNLVKIGKERAIVFHDTLLKKLGIDNNTELEIKVKNKEIWVTPIKNNKQKIEKKKE
ncbi:hypothetical protein ACFLYU_05075 [Candidatus Dependentiae bacterium]